jgi:hypothetical protein
MRDARCRIEREARAGLSEMRAAFLADEEVLGGGESRWRRVQGTRACSRERRARDAAGL